MGQVEGDIQVPPITSNFLFAKKADKYRALMDPRVSKSLNQTHDPYTNATLADAILNGKNIQGRQMNVAMPLYKLNEAELRALTSYLRQLSAQWSPGASQFSIRFAAVITPDIDPTRRKVIIDMMQSIVRQKNASTATAARGNARRHMAAATEFVLGTERTWDLDIWQLQGEPNTWAEQLAALYRSQPVFALISGASTTTWQPMHEFCAEEQIPCWFPSVDMPVKKPSKYSIYFSGGVLLEANVLARRLLEGKNLPKHVIQIFRDDVVGRTATQELKQALEGSSIKLDNRVYDANGIESLRALLAKQKSGDVVVYWLHQDDIALLSNLKPIPGVKNYFSSRLAGAENIPLSGPWKTSSHLVYLYELPEKRELNLTYFHVWRNLHNIPLVDEAMQAEVYFSLNYLTDTTSEMLDNLYRDYLLERAETMLDKREGVKSEQETRDRLYLGKLGELLKKHGEINMKENVRVPIVDRKNDSGTTKGTTIYPHLSLGAGQRFSSKGGYIVRFAESNSNKLVDESGWIVP
jgi:hypothetical protein